MPTGHSILFNVTPGDVLLVRRETAELLPALIGRSYADIRAEFGEGDGQRGDELQVVNGVAIIEITGPITRSDNICTRYFGGTSVDGIRRQLRMALASELVQSVVFFVSSPGGSAEGIADLADEIFAARRVKPTAAYVDGYGCSAAYWLATAAETVVVSQSGYVGSVGAYTTYLDDRARMEMNGVREIKIIASKSPRKVPDPATDEGFAQVQAHVDEILALFIGAVARQRGVSVKQVEADFGQGDIVIAKDAVKRGMADSVGTFDRLMMNAAKAKPGQPIKAEGFTLEADDDDEPECPTPDGEEGIACDVTGCRHYADGACTRTNTAAASAPIEESAPESDTGETDTAPEPAGGAAAAKARLRQFFVKEITRESV